MDMNQAFPSEYIKSADLQGKEVPLIIDHVVMKDVGQANAPDIKPVVYFKGTEKGLILNKTNSNTVCEMYGYESDMWCDKPITLITIQTEYQGKPCLGLRVKINGTSTALPAAPVASPIGAAPPFGGLSPTVEQVQDITNTESAGGVLDDRIPF